MHTHFFRPGYIRIIYVFTIFSFSACKKFVQIQPPATEITGSAVYSGSTSAAAVITGLYDNMISSPNLSSGFSSIGYLTGLGADELTNYDPTNHKQVQFYENVLTSFSNGFSNYYFWIELYNGIYVSNAVLEGLSNSSSVTAPLKQQLVGEAKFMRAFFLFYATNLYGDIPLVTTTNYLVNDSISRTPQAEVYKQIVADLADAQAKLPSGFVDANGNSSTQRVRPNQGAATSLLARVYLYTGKWDSAESEATMVISNSDLYNLDSLNSVFLANSTETIWQLQPTNPGFNTWDAFFYVLEGPPGPGGNSVAINPHLISTFENGDARLVDWVGAFPNGDAAYYYPFKYKVYQYGSAVTEYTMVLRLAEQYLIRAEARAAQMNITGPNGALADLNVIRNRAGLSSYSGLTDQQSVLAAILHERQVELFTEWGHRWFDLKRTNNLNTVMGAPGNVCQTKGGTWNSDWALLPIALQELKINPNLIQNPGY